MHSVHTPPPGRRVRRTSKKLLVLGLLGLALPLTGCVKITNQTHEQQQQIGDLRLSTTFCLTNTAGGATCPASDTNSGQSVGNRRARLLLAYRVPAAALAPSAVSVSSTSPPGTLSLSPSPTYTSELQRLDPAPADQKWVGYISDDVPSASQVANSVHTATADFGLPRGADGGPFPGPFDYQVAIGARSTPDASQPTPETVACGSSLTAWNDPEKTICSDSPKSPASLHGASVATKDVGVLNGPEVSAEQGKAISIPIQIRSVGSALPVMNLAAGTTAPAATATSSLPQIQPNGATQSVPVSVDVAANTPPGTYDVSLTATTTNGEQLRVGTSSLTVLAPPPPATPEEARIPPQGTFSVPRGQKLGKALRKGFKLRGRCSEACTAVVTLRRGTKVLATGRGGRTSAGSFTLTARFTKAARKKYARSRSLKLSIRMVVDDNAGLTDTASGRVTLKR